jgi:hypothetical protein
MRARLSMNENCAELGLPKPSRGNLLIPACFLTPGLPGRNRPQGVASAHQPYLSGVVPVSMMAVGRVGMRMRHRLVHVRVGVRSCLGIMAVLMVRVVRMAVAVLEARVSVSVLVALAEM